MKNQVLSIEQMQHLQELGVDTSKASMMYHFWVGKKYQNCFLLSVDIATPYDSENVPTFTLQDMLEMMPRTIYWNEDTYHFEMLKGESGYTICYGLINDNNDLMYCMIIHESNVIDCAYEALCWCAKNGHLKGGENESK